MLIKNAYAQELIPCKDGTYADANIGCTEIPSAIVNSQSDILSIILKTAGMVVSLAVFASVGVLVYGGIAYAMSLGNESKLKKAKDIIFWSLFGLMVSILAKFIVSAVLGIITQ